MTLPSAFQCGVNALCHVQAISAPAFRSLVMSDRDRNIKKKRRQAVYNVHLSSLGRREVFSTHAWHVRLSRAKELCILLTRGNKEKVRQKKTFPLLQATVTWQPPRNLKYHSAAAHIRDLCERHTVSSQKCSLSHTGIHAHSV